jgi:predicted RecB family endonuclease
LVKCKESPKLFAMIHDLLQEQSEVQKSAIEIVKVIKDIFESKQQAIKYIKKQIKETSFTVKKRDDAKDVIELCRQIVFDETVESK